MTAVVDLMQAARFRCILTFRHLAIDNPADLKKLDLHHRLWTTAELRTFLAQWFDEGLARRTGSLPPLTVGAYTRQGPPWLR
jgi:hypothetical protein